MAFKFSKRSQERMEGLHPDIVAVMELALARSPIDFTVLEGVRSVERQRKLVAKGSSKTMNSRHLTGHAIDVAPMDGGQVSWDWPLYHKLAPVIKGAAEDLGVDLEWGGDWTSFKDGPHWQLAWSTYSKTDLAPRASLEREMTERVTSLHDVEIPEPVRVAVADAGKPLRISKTAWASIMGIGASAWQAWQTADPVVQATALAVGGLLVFVFFDRFRKSRLGKAALAEFGL